MALTELLTLERGVVSVNQPSYLFVVAVAEISCTTFGCVSRRLPAARQSVHFALDYVSLGDERRLCCRHRCDGETAPGVSHPTAEASSTSGREKTRQLRRRTKLKGGQ